MKFQDLSKEEQEKWGKIAEEINELNLAPILHMLDEGILVYENEHIRVSGKYAFKMFQEKGIPLEIWKQTVENLVTKLLKK